MAVASLFELEYLFKKQLATYLLFSKSEDIPIDIKLNQEGIEFKFSLLCNNIKRSYEKVEGENRASINFDYYFKVGEENINFIKLYYKLYYKYLDLVIMYPPNYVESALIPKIFDEIKGDDQLMESIKGLMIYDKSKNQGKFARFESETKEKIKSLGGDIQFKLESTKTRSDLLPMNEKLLKELKKQFKTKNQAKIDLDKFYKANKFRLFEMYYKQYICDNLLFYLKDNAEKYHLLSLEAPQSDPFKHSKKPDVLSFVSSNKVWMGQFFPEIFVNDKKYQTYLKIFNQYETAPKLHTPYSLSKSRHFSYLDFTTTEELILYKTPVGKAKSRAVFPYDRFVSNYLTGKLTSDEQKFKNELLIKGEKRFPTFPRLYFNGDTFALLSLEVATAKSTHKITIRAMVFNTTTEMEGECLMHYKNAYDFKKWESSIKEKLLELGKIFDFLWDFYPYHPFFFNRKNHYATLYTMNVLNYTSDDIKDEKKFDLYTVHPIIDKLFDTYEVSRDANVLSYIGEIEEALTKKIITVYRSHLYLWIAIYLEKYYFYLCAEQNSQTYNDRSVYNLGDKLISFITSVESALKKEFNDKYLFKIITNVSHNPYHTRYYVFPRTDGLYYMIIYSVDDGQLKIIKLNCISFFPNEIIYLQQALGDIIKKKKFVTFRVPSNSSKGLLLQEISLKEYQEIISELKPRSEYDKIDNYENLLLAHKLSGMKEFNDKVKSGEFFKP